MFGVCLALFVVLFFFNDTATTEIYTLSLHDALPILSLAGVGRMPPAGAELSETTGAAIGFVGGGEVKAKLPARSEEHTSELQSLAYLVCRLLLEKKKRATLVAVRASSWMPGSLTVGC